MSKPATYEKEMHAKATERKSALFMVDVYGKHAKKGSMNYAGPISYELASKLASFCIQVAEGKKPQQVVKELWP